MTLPGLRDVEQAEEAREGRRLAYEPGLDGMRGIGVILMMLWHAEVSWIGDGPLFTIEMFFVLSGFLITSLFIIEHDNTSRIDLRRFWVRRARRLVPALVGLVALVTVWASLPSPWGPNAFETTGLRGDGVASMLYVSNWWYTYANQSYFNAFGSPSPFLHTWSLSLEEQFYVVVAVIAFFGLRRWSSAQRGWITFAVIGALLSAAWMATLARMGALTADGLWPFGLDPATLPDWLRTFLNMDGNGDLSRPYFGTDARIQSVFVGMAAAFLCQRIDWSKVKHRTVELLAFVGCGGLLVMFLATPRDLDAIFYGGFLLCDVLTAMAIISLMSPRRPTLWHTLSSRPLVFAGVLSYSLYVWHFPIFLILTEERIGVSGWQLDVVRIGVSTVVAYCSYRFVEYPIRTRGLRTPARRGAAFGAMAVVVVAFLVVSTRIAPGASDAPSAAAASGAGGAQRPVILAAGDSMAWTLALDANVVADASGSGPAVLPSATPGCTVTPGGRANGDDRRKGNSPECLDWPEDWQTNVDNLDPRVSIVLSWGLEVQDHVLENPDGSERIVTVPSPEWTAIESAAVQQMIDVLSSGGGHVALLTLPCLDAEAADSEHTNELAIDSARVDAMNDLLREAAARNPDTTSVIDLNGYLCPDGEHFLTEIDGVTMSVDGVHFSEEGAAKVWEWLLPQLEGHLSP